MSYGRLMDDHAAIDALIADLLQVATRPERPMLASIVLERLAVAIRDHRAAEDAVLDATLERSAGDRHAAAAVAAMRDLCEVEEAWMLYLYRWSPGAVAARWPAFCSDTSILMPEIRRELAREGGILYSLAIHYDLLATAG